ncbi:calcium-binding protein [Vibrio aestuarianus]|uniref:calcium-binding protein n=1 Tax=Vibrio aestuarianus TaxID=28171 RepID=UPI00237D0C96|nr:calcium-binding protein [Vibrio aestuarianus]MDE1326877.1 calcium-binding protein [Vibrio aestuarianus]
MNKKKMEAVDQMLSHLNHSNKLSQEQKDYIQACQTAASDPSAQNLKAVRDKLQTLKETEAGRSLDALGVLGGAQGLIVVEGTKALLGKARPLHDYYKHDAELADLLDEVRGKDKALRQEFSDLCEQEGRQFDRPPMPEREPFKRLPQSPLTLDLQGDGITTTGLSQPIYFDHNGDGKRTRTGFIDASDGLLALDLDQDGTISSGQELFGNNTSLNNGQRARHGFEALAQYDSNRDRRIDANDAVFQQLRVFQDLNQDGISQSHELFSLSHFGIQALNLNYVNASDVDENGNVHRQKSSYVLEDGTQRDLVDVWFKTNNRDLDYVEIAIPEEVTSLPNVNGIGSLPSLHYAMASDKTGRLQGLVETYLNSHEPEAKKLALTEVMFAWAGVAGPYKEQYATTIDPRKVDTLAAFYGRDLPRATGFNQYRFYKEKFQQLMDDIALRLNGTKSEFFEQVRWVRHPQNHRWYGDFSSVARTLLDLAQSQTPEAFKSIQGFFNQVRETDDPFATNLKGLYASLLDGVDESTSDLPVGFDQLLHLSMTDKVMMSEGDPMHSDAANDFMLGTSSHDRITTGTGTDAVYAGKGNDQITADYSGTKAIYGQQGDDIITVATPERSGYRFANFKEARRYSHTLSGGQGNDILTGGFGKETYLFNVGDGLDTITDFSSFPGDTDRILMGAGITLSDLSLVKDGQDMKIRIKGANSGDEITIKKAYAETKYSIEEVHLSDGTVIPTRAIPIDTEGLSVLEGSIYDDTFRTGHKAVTIKAAGGNDTIVTGRGNDVIDAGLGNEDVVYAGAGNDHITSAETAYGQEGDDVIESWAGGRLDGGRGDDTLSVSYAAAKASLVGGEGNDTLKVTTPTSRGYRNGNYKNAMRATHVLIGGKGNDYLYGGWGSDQYRYAKGDGWDIITDHDSMSTNKDSLVLGPSLRIEDMFWSRKGDDLSISIGQGATEQGVTIAQFYQDTSYQIEAFCFDDGTMITNETLADVTGEVSTELLIQAMGAFDDSPGVSTENALLPTQSLALAEIVTTSHLLK